jgi:hypothetical protein
LLELDSDNGDFIGRRTDVSVSNLSITNEMFIGVENVLNVSCRDK